ncbi:MAG TPA: efflux RND transporter periplasmic adaptor subunit [Gemmataceae bacterium]|nr:efflux RND transporter periplasmic adaptor subunit [Gemmataceae bacterium]
MDTSIQSVERLRDFPIADHERRGSRRPRKRRLIWLLAAVVLAFASAAGYSYRQVNNMPEADVFIYTGKPARDVLLDLSGFVVPRTKVIVSPQVNGIVSRVCIPEEGQKVKTGDLLFEVDDVRYKAEHEQAEAALATAEAQLEELQNGREPEEKAHARALYEQAAVQQKLTAIEYDRARKLLPNAIGPADFDRTLTNYHDARAAVRVQKTNVDIVEAKTRHEKLDAAKAEVKRAQATRDRAKYYFDKTKINAPADSEGKPRVFTVLQKNVNPGESIQADFVYTSLCTLADLSEMEAEIEVQERDLHLLHKGAPCHIIPDAYPDRAYRGVLGRIQPLVNRQRGVVQVKVAITAPDEYLLPDMNARVLFLKDTDGGGDGQDLPQIPVKALTPGGASSTVFVLDGQKARLRSIEIGEIVGDNVQVRGGLKTEDKILLPLDRRPLKDGKPVRLRGQGKDGAARKDAV